MGGYVGVWVDREKAHLVWVGDEETTMALVESKVEGRVRLSGGARSKTPYGPQDVASESRIEGRRKKHLSLYYQEIIRAIADADRIVIFGPGEAKMELQKEIDKSRGLSGKLAGVYTADKMTERQLAALVRNFFLPSAR